MSYWHCANCLSGASQAGYNLLNIINEGNVMRKLLSLLFGVSLGTGVGVLLVTFFAPAAREQLVSRLKQGWQESFEDARRASQQRRHELEADLAARLKAQD